MWKKQPMAVVTKGQNPLPQLRTKLAQRTTAAIACGLDVIHGPAGQHRNMISTWHIHASHRRSTSCTYRGQWLQLWATVSNSHFCCSSPRNPIGPSALGLVPHGGLTALGLA